MPEPEKPSDHPKNSALAIASGVFKAIGVLVVAIGAFFVVLLELLASLLSLMPVKTVKHTGGAAGVRVYRRKSTYKPGTLLSAFSGKPTRKRSRKTSRKRR